MSSELQSAAVTDSMWTQSAFQSRRQSFEEEEEEKLQNETWSAFKQGLVNYINVRDVKTSMNTDTTKSNTVSNTPSKKSFKSKGFPVIRARDLASEI
eukprot:CAMPEP_0170548816 /NCGR_PEP_ID=MMETSP0211-20121228/6999_1 /TAXON_ID=311385 /ORGANISM="Pseudokeronopsis sp., Strain OXSARD2" /LENGTH=96 /DNA_ID=CAMNT_0010854457 /DNA_START=219 /DNA_END=509 /DNA_ORIENTATION=+